jgi:hypothetical protein
MHAVEQGAEQHVVHSAEIRRRETLALLQLVSADPKTFLNRATQTYEFSVSWSGGSKDGGVIDGHREIEQVTLVAFAGFESGMFKHSLLLHPKEKLSAQILPAGSQLERTKIECGVLFSELLVVGKGDLGKLLTLYKI